ncbi:MAG TPA: response regulator [Spirochaetota bacterium]|nr:response regulator [Spirochaetota bacterium]HOR92358.1 response regulator [Spirochaetota bacterium]HOT18460.1 response regulator [Spirochaetota bacterium]HPD03791.1 response regulator [Spirochaetota bacterium]HPK43351.1 response regulator [Spirochaetota bacterium]
MARCMIVDDSSFMRRIIHQTLEEAGHQVVAEVDNGLDALSKYKEVKPDVVTMDITMWGKDGLEAISEITSDYPDAKIIIISALNERTLKINEKDINARLFLSKPFEKQELLDAIEKVLNNG